MIDHFNDEEIKEYLELQEGVTNVKVLLKEPFSEIIIEHTEETTPQILYKHIQLFEKEKNSQIIEFDKDVNYEYETIKYYIDDLCCEYCFKYLIYHLFNNQNIKSVKSNYDYHKPLCDMEFIIEYNKDYNYEELDKYIKEEI
jgi:copper chaperone CopZ